MEFIYAHELKKRFVVNGHFYNLNLSGSILRCRSVLEIKQKDYDEVENLPDAIIILMNPGSSRPREKWYVEKVYSTNELFRNFQKEFIPAKPDITQYQIMRLMCIKNWSFVRVLNLSDLRNGNSGKFRMEYINAAKLDNSNPHCLTHYGRKEELIAALRSKKNITIAAWGSIAELTESSEVMLELVNNIIGLRKGNGSNFRHASPRLKQQKIDWLVGMENEIAKSKLN